MKNKELESKIYKNDVKVKAISFATVAAAITLILSAVSVGYQANESMNSNSEVGFIATFKKGQTLPTCDRDPQIQMSKGYIYYTMVQTKGAAGKGEKATDYKMWYKEKNKSIYSKYRLFYPEKNNEWKEDTFLLYSNGRTDYNLKFEKENHTDEASKVEVKFFFGPEVGSSLSTIGNCETH